jgi:FkbM family methyltransferase
MTGSESPASSGSSITRSQSQLSEAVTELREGGSRLAGGPSRFGGLGVRARTALVRATRHLTTRQALLDEKILSAMASLAFDTSISHRGASSSPEPLDPSTVVDLKTRVGDLFVHAEDRVMTPLIAQDGSWELAESAFLSQVLRPGDTFVDVGANVGYFSVLGASLVGPSGSVVAVEPEDRNLALLKANLWRNKCANAVVLPLAAGREQGFLPLRFNEENRGDHQTGLPVAPDRLVPVAALDDLLIGRRVDCIKIDTQGSDHDVVAGSAQVIRASSATVMCEFWPQGMRARGIDPLQIAEQYREAGFTLRLLGEQASLRAVDPPGLVAAAMIDPIGYVNVVLRLDA